MRVNLPSETGTRGGFKAFAAQPRRIEKASESNSLGAQQQGEAPQERTSTPPLRVELVCQDETAAFDRFRDSPRLVPAFVAQLLGQAMTNQGAVSPAAAYRSARPFGDATAKTALLFDRKG